MNKPTHTLNPNTGREIQINGVRFLKLLKHGFKYDEKLNRLYDTPLPPDTTKYIPKSRMVSPNNCSMIIDGSAYHELLRDNYRPRGGKWVKMTKEEAKVYDNDSNIKKIFTDDQDDSSSESEYVDIDEFEYDEDGHAIFSFYVGNSLTIFLVTIFSYLHFGLKEFVTYI